MKGHSQTSFKTFHFIRAIDAPNTFHFYKEIRQLLFQVEMGTSEVVVGRNGKPLFPNSYKWLINWQVQPWNSCLQFASWLSKYCFVLDCWIEEFLRGETIQSYGTYMYVCFLLECMHCNVEEKQGDGHGWGEGCENQTLRLDSISQSKSTPTAQFRLNSAVAAPYDL